MIDKIKAKLEGASEPAKASITFTLCSICQKGIAFCAVPIYTRIMSQANFGYYTIFLSWMQIIAVIATLNLSYHVYMNGMLKYENDRDGYTSAMFGLSSLITLLVFCVYLAAEGFWNQVLGLPTAFVVLMFLEILLQPSYEYWSAYQRFQFKYKALAALTLGIAFIVPIVSIPLISYVSEEFKGLAAIAAKVGVTIIGYAIPMVMILSKLKKLYNREYWTFALKFNIPLIPHFLSAIIFQQCDRLMIRDICGDADVAMYSVAFSLSTIMTIVNTAIMNSMIPWTYQNMKKKNYEQIHNVAKMLCLLVATINMLIIFIAPDVMKILAPAEYSDGVYVIAPLIVSVYFMFTVNLFVNIEYYYAQVKYVMFGSIAAAVANVILNYIFINRFGFIAAGYTTLISYILYTYGHYVFMKIVLKKQVGDNVSVYDSKFILLLGGGMLLLSLVCSLLFQTTIIRYAFLAVILTVLFAKRKTIVENLQMMKAAKECG
ncbi:Polysaccharide biosynthesis protein [Sporomusa ovata DSM 2662]|uniref:Repeat unit transporter n=1 Tax=Sporomusa ovata TaxID=2378 RepID=A0A0U1KT07_9FIRM|nr:oligosaccharide flippase family protein [Sporomusa ovata]EQB26443.1 putative repeat unit transporter [Sporomusa ovata DSM 2662]CQR70527.1 repeat unit transporter [Sporomusa ovata]